MVLVKFEALPVDEGSRAFFMNMSGYLGAHVNHTSWDRTEGLVAFFASHMFPASYFDIKILAVMVFAALFVIKTSQQLTKPICDITGDTVRIYNLISFSGDG